MTGLLMAQDKDGKRVRPIIHIGPTQMGMGTPDGCALVFGILKAWTAADNTKCILSIDAGGEGTQ